MLSFERLKELKVEFEQMRKHNDRHYMSTITEDDVLEVLDEAITRQSVKSEDVAEAIDLLGELQHDNYVFQNYTEQDVKNYELISLAITALQAYQPWISVDDRPRKDNKYLAVLQFYKEPKDKTIEVVEYYGEWKVNYEWNVICYKPLPEPPKGE